MKQSIFLIFGILSAPYLMQASLGDAEFDNVSITDEAVTGNLTVNNSLDVAGSATFNNITAGTNSVTTLNVGCNLTVGCNIMMYNSSSASIGNILKNGTNFIHNYGTNNTFVGVGSGNFSTTGSALTGFGVNALAANTSGSGNTALGYGALAANTTGSGNTSLGYGSLLANISGSDTTALGYEALNNLTSGSNNVAIGYLSGSTLTAGSNNIYVGDQNTGVTSSDSGIIRIGSTTATNATYIQGIYDKTYGGTNSAVYIDNTGKLGTPSSSIRYKENIDTIRGSSDRFMQLRPVTFNYKSDETKRRVYGLIAEEVAELYPELINYNEDGEPESIQYHLLDAIMIKEIQKNRRAAHNNIDQLEELDNKYEAIIQSLIIRIIALEKLLNREA